MSTTLLSCDRHQYQAVVLRTVLEELEDEDRHTPTCDKLCARDTHNIHKHLLKLGIQEETGLLLNEGLKFHQGKWTGVHSLPHCKYVRLIRSIHET